MVSSSKNSVFFSDICRDFDTPILKQFPPKYRTRCSRRFLSGRLSRRGRKRAIKSLETSVYIYKTLSGRSGWPSRDPLGELGLELLRRGRPSLQGDGPNPYHFVGNNPISRFDVFGLYENCCCDANMIDRTRRILVGRYAAAESYLDPHRPLIMSEEGSWSCLNVARNVGNFMKPIPPCWTCYVENRRGPYKFEPFGGWVSHDLNAVVCVSHPKSGKPQKIVFDYWHHASPGEDYSVFAGNYPYSGLVDPSFLEGDCSKPIPHWTPNYGYLDLITDRPPPTNAPEWPNVPL